MNSTNVRQSSWLDGLGVTQATVARLAAQWLARPPRGAGASGADRARLAEAEPVALFDGAVRAFQWDGWREGTVSFVHGWGETAAAVLPLVPPLHERGWTVAAFDAPAHGVSAGTVGSVMRTAEALVAVAEHGGAPTVLVTSGSGLGPALHAIGNGWLAPRALVVVGPADGHEDAARALVERLGGGEPMLQRVLAELAVVHRTDVSRAALLELAKGVRLRTLLVGTVDDALTAQLASAWPHAEQQLEAGVGPLLPRSAVRTAIAEFVDRAPFAHGQERWLERELPAA